MVFVQGRGFVGGVSFGWCGGGSIHHEEHEGHEESEEGGTIQACGHATVVRLPSSVRLSFSFVFFVSFVVMNLTSLDSSYEIALECCRRNHAFGYESVWPTSLGRRARFAVTFDGGASGGDVGKISGYSTLFPLARAVTTVPPVVRPR